MKLTHNKATLSLDDELKKDARIKAITDGTSLTAVVTVLLRMWLAGKIKIDPQNQEDKK